MFNNRCSGFANFASNWIFIASLFFHSHNMHLFKCHSENPSRHNSFDDLIGDRALSDSEAGTSMFLLTEVCGYAHGLCCPMLVLCSMVTSIGNLHAMLSFTL